MKLAPYLKDNIVSYIIGIGVVLIVMLICDAFGVQKQAE